MNHSFDIEIARQYGVNAAILLNHIYFWCQKNRANGANYRDGNYWTFNSRRAFAEQFPYMSEHQIKTALKKLIDGGLIETATYNEDRRDRSLWYAVTKKGQCICQNCTLHDEKTANAHVKNDQPLPDTNTDTDTDTNADGESPSSPIPGTTPEEAEADNPFGDGAGEIPAQEDTVQAYALNELTVLGVRAMEELNSYVEDLSADIVRYAIDNALDNGVRRWSYVRSILQCYVDEDVRTVAEAREADARFLKGRARASPRGRPGGDPSNPALTFGRYV